MVNATSSMETVKTDTTYTEKRNLWYIMFDCPISVARDVTFFIERHHASSQGHYGQQKVGENLNVSYHAASFEIKGKRMSPPFRPIIGRKYSLAIELGHTLGLAK